MRNHAVTIVILQGWRRRELDIRALASSPEGAASVALRAVALDRLLRADE
jgi:hypothetical protein